jgi:hypothetical protein
VCSGMHPERRIRTGKNTGIGRVPVLVIRDQHFMAGRRADRRHPAGLAPADRPRRRPGPRRAQDPALPGAARRRPVDSRRPAAPPQDFRELALGRGHRCCLGQDHRPAARSLNCGKPWLRHQRKSPGTVEPRPPGPPAGPLSYPSPTIKINKQLQPSRKAGELSR